MENREKSLLWSMLADLRVYYYHLEAVAQRPLDYTQKDVIHELQRIEWEQDLYDVWNGETDE